MKVGVAYRIVATLATLSLLLIVPPSLLGEVDAQVSDLPLIDAHDHLQGRTSAGDLIKLMDLTGVRSMVLMALVWSPEFGTDRQALEYGRKYPGRFLPFVAFQRPGYAVRYHWLEVDSWASDLLHEAEDELKAGGFHGIGEIILRHYDYSLPQFGVKGGNGEVDIPADSPMMFRIAELAIKYRVPMLIHAEGEPRVVAATEHLLKMYSDARVIWAHNCGRQSAPEIRRLLGAYANLYCDLAGMIDTNGYGAGWPRSELWTFLVWGKDRRIFPDMKATFEIFPDRFLGVGTDSAHNGEFQYFVERIGRYRLLRSQLSPVTANKMAHENAERLFGLPPGGK